MPDVMDFLVSTVDRILPVQVTWIRSWSGKFHMVSRAMGYTLTTTSRYCLGLSALQ